jgi:hypothetical protein
MSEVIRIHNENELIKIELRYSTIKECLIKRGEEIISTKKNYKSILIDIWKTMRIQNIFQNSTFNIKLTNENGEKGYRWCSKLNISIQNQDAKGTLKEILNMVKVNKLTIKLTITLETGQNIYFNLE